MKIIWSLIFGAQLFTYSVPTYAISDILFGPEFTFVDLESSEQKPANVSRVIFRMHNHLVLGQPEGARFSREEDPGQVRGSFTSPNGWKFTHHPDGSLGFEVQVTPGTIEYFRKYAADMQDAIFVSAANEGFMPALFYGGGHINISFKPFLTDPLLFRNFIVDLWNHNELFMGVFGYDTNNALPLDLANPYDIGEVKKIIARFDAGEFRDTSGMIEFTRHLKHALDTADPLLRMWHAVGYSTRTKFHAISFNRIAMNDSGRLELRGVRPQASMDVWLRQIELLHARLKYLEKVRVPIPYRPRVSFVVDEVRSNHMLNPPLDPQLALREFHGYVRQSGKKWEDHRDYLWPQWITDGELDKFEKSKWFLRRERHWLQRGTLEPKVDICEGELVASAE